MKKGMTLTVIMIIALLFSFTNVSAEEFSFRGMKWGSKVPESFKKFEIDPSYGGIQFYTKPNENLNFGSCIATKVTYGYWNEKLCSIRIYFDGYINFTYLLESMKEKYGNYYKPNKYIESYYWFSELGRTTYHETNIILKYNEIQEKGAASIRSNVISKQQEEYDKKKAKEGKNSF